MISVLIIFLVLSNIITIYLLNKKSIKKYFAKSFIKSVNLEKVNKIFESEKISENLYGPKKDVIVKSFCVPSGNKDIVGKTSDYEAWILSSLSKISKSDVSVSITGIAGPSGGTKQKPIGLVYIGIKRANKVKINRFLFKNRGRSNIQKAATKKALELILNTI